MAIAIVAQATATTTSGASQLLSPQLSVSQGGGPGLPLLFVIATAPMGSVQTTGFGGGGPLTRRWAFGGPAGLYLECWVSQFPVFGAIQVLCNVQGAPPTNWGFGAYVGFPTLGRFGAYVGFPTLGSFDPTSAEPFVTVGGGPVAPVPYTSSTPLGSAIVAIATTSSSPATGPSMWTPLSSVVAGGQSMAVFIAAVPQGSGVFIGALPGPPTSQWLEVSDMLLGVPPPPDSPAAMQACWRGPPVPLVLPPAPVNAPAPTQLAPANTFKKCASFHETIGYYTPQGAPASGP